MSLVSPALARPDASPRPRRAQTPAPHVVLDLSRLLSRVQHPTPTGIDRVELAYAQGLVARIPGRLSFSVMHPAGPSGEVSPKAAAAFLAATAERWEHGEAGAPATARWRRAAAACLALTPRLVGRAGVEPAVYLHLSPRALERQAPLARLLRRRRARFVPFIHDIIPLTHPEYARPQGPARLRRKLDTVLALADGVLVNSRATAEAVAPLLAATGRDIPIHAAPLAAPTAPAAETWGPVEPIRPYFVVLGTIEPRKNHLLLLHLWRRLVERLGEAQTPRLVVIGRRGWENEMVLDLLDRCPALQGVVEERRRLPDAALRQALRGARAVLMPSFAEGFGLPLVEALQLGAPVLASDLPAHREAGGGAPDYLDPLDAPAWTRAVLDYAAPQSPARARQLQRLAAWRAPSWDEHLDGVLDFIDGLDA